ncbi:unnamed protein product [Discosporangium mesarthrocarpum]
MDMTRFFLSDRSLPEGLWPEAVQMAVYVRNRSLRKFLWGRTPFQIWTGNVPKLTHI